MKLLPWLSPLVFVVLLLALALAFEGPALLWLVLGLCIGFVAGLLAPALWRPRRTWPHPAAASAGDAHGPAFTSARPAGTPARHSADKSPAGPR